MTKIVAIVGPTASGKTALGLRLAESCAPAEIISADSQQVYRGMDIGTGKAREDQRAHIRHHLLDVNAPDEPMTAARFAALADAAISDIVARGAVPLVVGGTGLYVRALLRGLFAGPSADPTIRARLEAEGVESLYMRLRDVDPLSAERIDRRDLRRIVRALEVHLLTGVPMSAHQRAHGIRGASPRYSARVVGLDLPREELRRRIEERVDGMFAAGLVEEVRGLMSAYAATSRAFDAIGYREVIAHLRGEMALPQTVAAIKAATRRYARRQLAWFRSEADVTWYKSERDVDIEELAEWLRAEGT